MGRKKVAIKKVKLSIAIDDENRQKLNEHRINKSKLVNWLLFNYFNEKGDVI